MPRVFGQFFLVPLFLAVFGQSGLAMEPIPVFVSIAPQKYVVQQIGKEQVHVQVMVPPGADPHTYEPKPQQMVAISKARLYFAIGIEFERANLEKIVSTNPRIKVVQTDEGIRKIPMATHHQQHQEDHPGNQHHHPVRSEHVREGHPHAHGGLDPHIWLSPPLVKIQARTILDALHEIDPGHRAVYEANYRRFIGAIDELDADLKTTFATKEGLQFMVFHPAWGYFADAYGLEQVPVEIEGKDPKPAQLKELMEHAKKRGIKVIFVQPQFSARSAQVVANEIGAQVAFVDPLAEDWLANLSEVSRKFKAALK